jgi:hypothetical protein
MSSSFHFRRVAAALTLAAVTMGASLATAGSATAAPAIPYIKSNSGGANMRTCATTGCGSVAYLQNTTEVYMLCWTDGEQVDPPGSNYSSNRWFKVERYGSNQRGYVHSSLVERQSAAPRC